MTIKQSVETVSPESAKRLLATQVKNRKPVTGHVVWLASIMRRGEWGVAQPIIFDEAGHLIDGQHRLLAVVEYGEPVRFAVIRGVSARLWNVLDTGRTRNGKDVLSAEGHTSSCLLAATLRLVWQDEMGVLASTAPEARPTNADLIDRDAEHPEIARQVVPAVSANRLTRNSPIAFLYWRSHRAALSLAEEFWPPILTNEGLRRETPPYLLHSLLLKQATAKKRLDAKELLALAIKAWNCALLDAKPKLLRWACGSEEFPLICATRAEAQQAARGMASKSGRAA